MQENKSGCFFSSEHSVFRLQIYGQYVQLNFVLFSYVPVDACCRKQDSLRRGALSSDFRDKQTPPLSTIPYATFEKLTTLDGPAVIDSKATYWLRNAIFAPVRGVPVGILP